MSFKRRGALVVVDNLEEAFALANRIAPEHLELDLKDAPRWLPRVRAAGAVFVGELSPAPLGDYLAGPNHVLPTGGAARFASPLGAYDFVARTSIIEASARAIEKLGPRSRSLRGWRVSRAMRGRSSCAWARAGAPRAAKKWHGLGRSDDR